ncbi:MAG: hypothetical protein ACD_57C00150G0002 [uncultured bacterium]|nr:MAG: hypothetical protein ACD_57C00150G0002 [uncultured bacterium]OGM14693.1 MAG: hypothetical protein A2W15_01880 [Candidatus Woesebacteria bacterium RBG_16_41_13]OGM29707.1 MAG: hypothetical protein A2873_02300 [Candidatus Woesebacteria bacterium RIFCSPHIGHO2_01_FULL_42_80]OGM35235.1 MAG: hypothetical protein A3D84_00380 [Candidatus Woesebacteria bacterium RIFCSPHIGHO2_02_FULL_42_20]OGM67701.1 MAG: hypothetical protein A2969_02090 [Candidatus Woesebacteria bacterium RIFCSPLOWO2_01_FULL_42_
MIKYFFKGWIKTTLKSILLTFALLIVVIILFMVIPMPQAIEQKLANAELGALSIFVPPILISLTLSSIIIGLKEKDKIEMATKNKIGIIGIGIPIAAMLSSLLSLPIFLMLLLVIVETTGLILGLLLGRFIN